MNDDLTMLERVLRDRGGEVPYLQEAPPKMLARARGRVVRNALASVVAAGLIVAGASAGLASLGALRGPNRVIPAVHSPAPGSAVPACIATNLRATADLQGAAGSVLGSIDLTNLGAKVCTLQGRPVVTVFSPPAHEVSVHLVDVAPQFEVDGASPPHGWPVVRLRPGAAAAIRVRWANPCPQLTGGVLWRVGLGSGRGTLNVFGTDATPPPPCNGPTEPSTLEVGPFEPGPE